MEQKIDKWDGDPMYPKLMLMFLGGASFIAHGKDDPELADFLYYQINRLGQHISEPERQLMSMLMQSFGDGLREVLSEDEDNESH